MDTPVIGPKDVGENRVVGFDFSTELAAGENLSGASVAVTVIAGSDPASNAILSGSPFILGSLVKQRVVGGVAKTTYHLRCTATTDGGNTIVVAGNLPSVTL